MPIYNRLYGSITLGVLVAATSAYAEAPALTDPPSSPPTAPACEAETPPPGCPAPAPAPQPAPPPPAPAMTTAPEVDVYAVSQPWYKRIGVGMSLGGGVDDFVGDTARRDTSTGGSWNVRATFGTHYWLAAEVSYIGSAQSIDRRFENEFFLGDHPILFGNGIQGAARVNILPHYAVQPFLYIGAAWRHYDISSDNNTINTTNFDESDDVVEMPMGVGLAGYVGGLIADVRGEYRGGWGANDLIINGINGQNDNNTLLGEADRWGVTGSVGMEF